MISLDNIDFYHHPPPPKPPAHTSSSYDWKSYHVSSAPPSLSFSHPLPPKPPTAVTAVPTSTIKGHFQCAAPRNIFDIELEKVPTRENSPVERETDLEAGNQSGPQAGNDLGDRCQDASPTLVPVSSTSEPPVIPAGIDDCEGDGRGEGGGNQLVTRRRALQDQLDTCPQSRGDAVCSGQIVTAAEAGSGYSGGRSVSAVENLPGDPDCLQLFLSGCEAEKQTTTTDGVPKHHNSQLPSPALSNPASPENKRRARPRQHHGIMFEDLPSEAPCCGEQTRALMVSASNSPTATPSIASSRDASTDCEDNNISVLPSLNLPSHRFHQASASCGSKEDQPTDSFTGNHSLLTRKAAADGGKHPQKRRRRNMTSNTAQNTSVSASCHCKGSIATFEAPSGVDFLTSPGEAQEIFGRGIIRIQPHGQRHAYFLTFLPDAVDRPLSHVQPRSAPDRPLCTKRAPHTSSKACAAEKGNVQLAHRQTQNQRANPKTRNNHSTRHKDSRKGMPWLPEEEELLVKLKRDQGLPWSDVTRLFSEQYPGRTQGSIQVYWSTNLSKRSPLNFCPRLLPCVSSSNESWQELRQPADEQNDIPIDPVILTSNGPWDAEDERQHIHADGDAVISESICRYPDPPPLLRDTLAENRNSNAYPEAQEGNSRSDSPLRNQSRAQVSADDNNPEAHIRASNNPPEVPNSAQLSKPCKRKLQQSHGQPQLCKRVRGSS